MSSDLRRDIRSSTVTNRAVTLMQTAQKSTDRPGRDYLGRLVRAILSITGDRFPPTAFARPRVGKRCRPTGVKLHQAGRHSVRRTPPTILRASPSPSPSPRIDHIGCSRPIDQALIVKWLAKNTSLSFQRQYAHACKSLFAVRNFTCACNPTCVHMTYTSSD